MSKKEIKLLLEAGIEMQKRNLTVETWGNLSLRDEHDHVYITPSGMPYDRLKEEDVVILNMDGTVYQGERKPSVEAMMHILIYQNRKDVSAIMHTHPVASAVFAVLHQPIPVITDEMAQAIGGAVQVTEYALPGSMELAENTVKALGNRQACLLANHGAVCVGKDFRECFKVAEVLESSSEIYQKALAVGTPHEIAEDKVKWMRDFALYHYGQK